MQDETTRLVQEGLLLQGAFASTALHIDSAGSDGDESGFTNQMIVQL
jgi:hypothetical protein